MPPAITYGIRSCIYGGIWAEMLEDRKFYFPITAEYSPYRALTTSAYPVVGASPWEIIGDVGFVTMQKQDAFVGDHSPRVTGTMLSGSATLLSLPLQ